MRQNGNAHPTQDVLLWGDNRQTKTSPCCQIRYRFCRFQPRYHCPTFPSGRTPNPAQGRICFHLFQTLFHLWVVISKIEKSALWIHAGAVFQSICIWFCSFLLVWTISSGFAVFFNQYFHIPIQQIWQTFNLAGHFNIQSTTFNDVSNNAFLCALTAKYLICNTHKSYLNAAEKEKGIQEEGVNHRRRSLISWCDFHTAWRMYITHYSITSDNRMKRRSLPWNFWMWQAEWKWGEEKKKTRGRKRKMAQSAHHLHNWHELSSTSQRAATFKSPPIDSFDIAQGITHLLFHTSVMVQLASSPASPHSHTHAHARTFASHFYLSVAEMTIDVWVCIWNVLEQKKKCAAGDDGGSCDSLNINISSVRGHKTGPLLERRSLIWCTVRLFEGFSLIGDNCVYMDFVYVRVLRIPFCCLYM